MSSDTAGCWCCWDGGMGVCACACLMRTVCKSLACDAARCESGGLRPGSSTTRAPQRQRRIKGSFVLYPFLRPTHGHTSARAPTSNYLVPRLGFAVFPNFLSLDPSLGAPSRLNASTCRPHRRASPLDLSRCSCFHLFETGPPSCPAPGLSLVLIPDRALSPPISCAVIASL